MPVKNENYKKKNKKTILTPLIALKTEFLKTIGKVLFLFQNFLDKLKTCVNILSFLFK